MLKFLIHFKDENKSPNYISNVISTIRSFYAEFEIELPRIRCNIKEIEDLITTEDIISKKHIRKVLKYCNIKYKAIILLMMSSGMGSSEIRHLKFDEFLKSQEIQVKEPFDLDQLLDKLEKKRNSIGTWSIRRYKTSMPYVTFNSPEATNALIDYINHRSEKKYPVKNYDDILFEAQGQPMGERGFTSYFSRLNDRVGFGYKGRQRFFRSHGLRKFFASALKNNGMDTVDAEWLIGHKLHKITGTYIKPDIYRLKKDYMDILPHLCIEDIKITTVESDEVKEIKTALKKEREARLNMEDNIKKEVRNEVGWILDAIKKSPKIREEIEKFAPEDL